ncbi:NAD(P)/FAD-dependent oxidoreductase [Tropicimonas marinistellae]|uniref:NAD(P)/FAD-dependent oxidoreductase n=1 Tax=Tropicimonas marinistellae TaxID=1739787 RepID=UPI00082BA474|nr:NAD(P)/FAD-dependent oxidoreductase [Tropicimonas marinistellae]
MIDVAIIGGSFSGLTAALQLGRASRSVTVVDAGAPRNRMSPAAHGVPGWDGVPPSEILARIRADVMAYPTVRFVSDEVMGVARDTDCLRLECANSGSVETRRVLLAHGIRDRLPDLPGAAEAWGTRLLHCPYCHGFELRNRPLAVLGIHPMSGHQATMLRADWSDDVTLLTGMGVDVDIDGLGGVSLDARPVTALRESDDGITAVFENGTSSVFAGVFAAPRVTLADTPAEMLGCAMADGPLGPFVLVGPMGQTSVQGVFAAGDCASPAHSVTPALGAGAMAGVGCHQSLLFPDMFPPFEVSK